jgi:hypothetical protein
MKAIKNPFTPLEVRGERISSAVPPLFSGFPDSRLSCCNGQNPTVPIGQLAFRRWLRDDFLLDCLPVHSGHRLSEKQARSTLPFIAFKLIILKICL